MAKLITKTFDNLYEYREFAEKCAKEENYSIVSRVKREAGRNDFYGNLKFEDTIEAMKYGIKDYTSYFLENIADTTSEEYGGQGIFMDIEGFAYDMGAVVSGEPECCINWNDVAPTKVSNNVYRIEAVEFSLPASSPRIVRPSRLMGWKDYEGYTFRCGELCGKSYMARDSKIELDQHLHDVEEITQEEFYEALTEFHKQIEEGLKKLIVEEQKREI